MNYTGITALVTGASSGLGSAFARELGRRGANVVAVGRDAARLEELAVTIGGEAGVKVHPIALDLGGPEAGRRLHEAVDERGLAPSLLINNAGLGTQGAFVNTDPARLREQVDVNVTALIDITRAFAPDLVARRPAAMVNVASLTGYMPLPGMAVYAASKAFVLSFTEALAYEMRNTGVTVVALSPGPTNTQFYRRSGSDDSGVRFETPEQVVATAFRALGARRPPASVVSGRGNRFTSRVLRLLPRPTVLRLTGRGSR